MEALWQDLRYATRTLLKRPLFTLLVVITLALGIGANTAIFSIVYAVVLKPLLPFKESDRIVSLGETNSGWSTTLASKHAFVSWQERSTVFERMTAMVWWDANLEGVPEPSTSRSSASRATTFGDGSGADPGAGIRPEEMVRGGPKSVIISYPIWQHLGI